MNSFSFYPLKCEINRNHVWCEPPKHRNAVAYIQIERKSLTQINNQRGLVLHAHSSRIHTHTHQNESKAYCNRVEITHTKHIHLINKTRSNIDLRFINRFPPTPTLPTNHNIIIADTTLCGKVHEYHAPSKRPTYHRELHGDRTYTQ